MDKQYLKEWINNLKRNVNIVDVVRHYINLKFNRRCYYGKDRKYKLGRIRLWLY